MLNYQRVNGIWHVITKFFTIAYIYHLVNVYKKPWTIPPFLLGKLTVSMAIFISYVELPEGMHDGDSRFAQHHYMEFIATWLIEP